MHRALRSGKRISAPEPPGRRDTLTRRTEAAPVGPTRYLPAAGPTNPDAVKTTTTTGSRGTGFGLAITKKLVQEHSIRVWFHSELGKGTTFFLELPVRAQRPAAVLV